MMTTDATPSPGADRPKLVETTPAELLDFAKRCHRAGDHDAALEAYEALAQVAPGDSEVEHFTGILLYQMGQRAKGMDYIERSLKAEDAQAGWWTNYGNILGAAKRPNDAIDAYKEAITRDPDAADAFSNLGVVQKEKYNYDIAIACFQKAIAIDPEHGLAWSNLGNLLVQVGKTADGVHALLKSLAVAKGMGPKERRMLAFAFGALGEVEKAQQVYREWLEEDPQNPVALHHLAAVSGETPARADDKYVTRLFDSFAESFDEKLAYLEYVVPKLVVDEAATALGEPRADRLIADAGCGTGLCGPGLRPYARRLVGVDLSGKMIERAKTRASYDMLVVGELTEHFAHTSERFDLIVSADTLCYFGDLAAAMAAFRRSLKDGGVLVFTVEAHVAEDDADFRLNFSGRYAHRASYLRAVLAASGFAPPILREEVLRKEIGKDVNGYVVRAEAAGSATGLSSAKAHG
jgi:predicted TPR repeat methyltransferase